MLLLTGLLLVAIGSGCGGGGGGGGSDPADVVQTFFTAVGDGDGAKACDQLSKDGLDNLVPSGKNCENYISGTSEKQRAPFGDATGIKQVTGNTEHCGTIHASSTNAEVVVTVSGDVRCVNLGKVGGDWKINDI